MVISAMASAYTLLAVGLKVTGWSTPRYVLCRSHIVGSCHDASALNNCTRASDLMILIFGPSDNRAFLMLQGLLLEI